MCLTTNERQLTESKPLFIVLLLGGEFANALSMRSVAIISSVYFYLATMTRAGRNTRSFRL